MKTEIINLFDSVNVRFSNGKPNLYKPVLLLYTLKECYLRKPRLILFKDIDTKLTDIFKAVFPDEHLYNFHYAFGRLENDKIWEITNSHELQKTESGDLYKSELINKNISGGFSPEIYQALTSDSDLIKTIYLNILNKYFDKSFHAYFLQFIELNNNDNRGKRMTLMYNQGEPVSRWMISKGINIIKTDREIFSSANMRRARLEFIAGSNRLGTIKSWLLAAQLIKSGRKESELTDFGFAVLDNDPNLNKSSTWWAFHLATCFSTESEPYSNLFLNLETASKEWIAEDKIVEKVKEIVKKDDGTDYGTSTIESLLGGVRKMFEQDRPLADLGLIEIRKSRDEGVVLRLGSPKLTDEIIIHALAMARFHCFKSRSGVNFSELVGNEEKPRLYLQQYLCCSAEELRLHLRRMNQSQRWQNYFSFTEAVNLESIGFTDDCDPKKTLLLLLQQGQDTWL